MSADSRWPLLTRMGNDLHQRGTLRRSTAALMWSAYGPHALATAAALTRLPSLPLPGALAHTLGPVATCAGAGLLVGGSRRFTGASELTGTAVQPLVTGGIYRHSRNPQYLGYVLTLGGLALARRSTPALALTGLLAALYAAWVPVEEEHLTRRLGEPCITYRQRTHRWWGHR